MNDTQRVRDTSTGAKVAEKPELSLREHLRRASLARWAKRSAEERSAHGKMMVAAREAKRLERRAAEGREPNWGTRKTKEEANAFVKSCLAEPNAETSTGAEETAPTNETGSTGAR